MQRMAVYSINILQGSVASWELFRPLRCKLSAESVSENIFRDRSISAEDTDKRFSRFQFFTHDVDSFSRPYSCSRSSDSLHVWFW